MYSIKVFYGSGDCLVLNIPTSDSDDIPEIVRRLEEISIGCQVKQIVLPGFLVLSMLHACTCINRLNSSNTNLAKPLPERIYLFLLID